MSVEWAGTFEEPECNVITPSDFAPEREEETRRRIFRLVGLPVYPLAAPALPPRSVPGTCALFATQAEAEAFARTWGRAWRVYQRTDGKWVTEFLTENGWRIV